MSRLQSMQRVSSTGYIKTRSFISKGRAMACCFWGSTVTFGSGGRENYSIDTVARKWKRRKEMMRMMMRMNIAKAMRSDRRTLLHSFSVSSSSLLRFQGAESFRSRTNSMASSSSSSNGSYGDGDDNDITTFSSKISTDIPLYQPPGVSFDDYINDRPRIFRAMFPDNHRTKQLNDEEWRIKMLPIKFFFASVSPVIDMRLRCKSNGEDCPPSVPRHVTRILELQATRWELKGIEGLSMPSKFTLKVQGMLYSVNRGAQSRLKGNLEMSISLVLPPALALIPMDALKVVTESLLTSLVERMKKDVDAGLLSDFSNYMREKLEKDVQSASLPATPLASATTTTTISEDSQTR